jgi:hypothetical protein
MAVASTWIFFWLTSRSQDERPKDGVPVLTVMRHRWLSGCVSNDLLTVLLCCWMHFNDRPWNTTLELFVSLFYKPTRPVYLPASFTGLHINIVCLFFHHDVCVCVCVVCVCGVCVCGVCVCLYVCVCSSGLCWEVLKTFETKSRVAFSSD